MIDAVNELTTAFTDELIAFRRRLHTYPELSGQESATTEAIVDRLRVAGLTPVVLQRGTGVICDIPGTSGRPMVALRADIDALAMNDLTTASYQSRVPGVSHACGHDVHTAVVLGAGLVLQELSERGELSRSVRLIFEPAEETMPGGAKDVIEQGGLDGVERIFGLHCDPKIDVGTIGVRDGAITSAADAIEIHVLGPGGHTARPHFTVDLLSVVGRVLTLLPEAVVHRVGTTEAFSVVFGTVQSGHAANVIPARAVLRGSVRTTDLDAWDHAEKAVTDALGDVLADTGAHWELHYTRGVPPVVNEELATGMMRNAAAAVVGSAHVVETPRSMGGDTFAWFAQEVPAAFARLGTHGPKMALLDLHASTFDVDERAIGIGVRTLVGAVVMDAPN